MDTTRQLRYTLAATAVAFFAVAASLHASGLNPPVAGYWSVESVDLPRHIQRHQSALGLKLPQEAARALGQGGATTRLLANYARAAEGDTAMLYAVERLPTGPGLRHSARSRSVVVWGGTGWSASLESGTSTDAFTGNRRATLLTQLHTPLVGPTGFSAGVRYQASQGLAWSTGETPLMSDYALFPGRLDAATHQVGYHLQFSYLYGERNAVALTYNSRRDFDQLAIDPLGLEGRQLSLTGEHWFSPSWGLRYDIGAPDSGNVARRQGLRLGVHYRF